MGSYTWICLALFYIFVTKTARGHTSLDSAQDDVSSADSSMNTMLFKFLLETLVRDSSDLNDKIDKLEEKYHEQKDKIEELENILAEQNDENLELKENLASSEKLVTEQSEKISAIDRKQYMDHNKIVVTLEMNLADKESEISELKEILETNMQLLKDQNDKIFQLETDNLSSKEKLEEHNGEIAILKARLEASEQDNQEQSEKISVMETMLQTGQPQTGQQNSDMSVLEQKIVLVEETCQEWFAKQDNKTSRFEAELLSAERTCQKNIDLQKNKSVELETSLKTHEGANEQKFQSQTDKIESLRKEFKLAEQNLASRISDTKEILDNFKSKDDLIYFSAFVRDSYTCDSATCNPLSNCAVRFNVTSPYMYRYFNRTTYMLTIPVDGWYLWSYSVEDPDRHGIRFYLTSNLSHNRRGSYVPESAITHLNRGDQIYVRSYDFPHTVKQHSWISGFLLKADD